MEYRIDKQTLFDVMEQWNSFLRRKVHLIACGGTAMTLLQVKPSTKDVDFMIPKANEYDYLIKILKTLYDIAEPRIAGHIDRFMDLLEEKKIL